MHRGGVSKRTDVFILWASCATSLSYLSYSEVLCLEIVMVMVVTFRDTVWTDV